MYRARSLVRPHRSGNQERSPHPVNAVLPACLAWPRSDGYASAPVSGLSKAHKGRQAVPFTFPRRAIAAAALVATILLLRPAAADIPPELQAVIAGAKKEGALTLQYAENIMGGTEGSRVAAAGIEKMFGVKLDVSFTPGPSFAPMATKLYTEMQAGQKASTDVYNGTAVQIYPFLERGLFRKIDWPKLYPGRITPQIAEADGRALRIVTALPGVLYNPRVAPEFGKVAP